MTESQSISCKNWLLQSYNPDATLADRYDILSHVSATWFSQDQKYGINGGVRDSIVITGSYTPEQPDNADCYVLESKGLAFNFPYYKRVQDVTIRGRPVFDSFDGADGEFLCFNGRRWIAIKHNTVDCLVECDPYVDDSCLVDCLKQFDPFLSEYSVHLISERMKLRTADDTWIPTDGLIWYESSGTNHSASPKIEDESFAESITRIPDLLNWVENRIASDADLLEAQLLFTQSSRLQCRCSVQDSEDIKRYQDELECSKGKSLWVDLKTDNYPEETIFTISEVDDERSFELGVNRRLRAIVSECNCKFCTIKCHRPVFMATGCHRYAGEICKLYIQHMHSRECLCSSNPF